MACGVYPAGFSACCRGCEISHAYLHFFHVGVSFRRGISAGRIIGDGCGRYLDFHVRDGLELSGSYIFLPLARR